MNKNLLYFFYGKKDGQSGNITIFRKLLLISVLTFQVFIASALSNSIHYVKADATGNNNGTSWADAYTSLQSALDAAVSGDKIWVAKGTYKPSSSYTWTNTQRFYHFEMIEGVSIYGGFEGNETAVGDRENYGEGEANETILSGDLGNEGDNSDNCYHVIYNRSALALTNDAVLNGFTIKYGNADYIDSHRYGGGMANFSCSPTLENIVICDNTCSYRGAGLYNNFSSPKLINITISRNTASGRGGGMYNYNSSPQIETGSIIDNLSQTTGGGIYNAGSSSPTLTNVKIMGNKALISAGGVYNYTSCSPVLTNVLICKNTATDKYGGGIYNYGATVELNNVTISGNVAGTRGGGIYNAIDRSSSCILKNSIVWGNTAGTGADIYVGNGTTTVNYSCYEEVYNKNSTFTPDANSITESPLFIDAENEDYRIYGISPCVNTGNNSDNTETTDVRGKARIQNSTIDMGAYEWTDGIDAGCASQLVHMFRNDIGVGDYCTIQNAIDASQDGDSIYIEAGTFTEQLTITTGIVLQGAGADYTIIESPNSASLAITGGTWKTLKNQDPICIIGIKSTNDVPVTIRDLKVDGQDQGRIISYTSEDDYDFIGIGAFNTTVTVDDVYVTGVRNLASDYGDVVPSGYTPIDQPSGMNHNSSVFAESSASAGEHTFTIANSYIDKFQKTAIVAWGPTLTVDIHDNTIQGYGQTLWSTGNGIQIASSDRTGSGGANGDRRGTKGSITNNQILDMGLVIPEPGEDGSYLNKHMFSSSCVLLYEVGDGFIISGNTITRTIQTKSWHVDFFSEGGYGFGSTGIDIVSSKGVIIQNNILEGYDEAIAIEEITTESSVVAGKNTVSNNTIAYGSFSGPNNISLGDDDEVLTYHIDSPGKDTISNFSLGDSIWIVNILDEVINGKLINGEPSIDYSNGTITAYDGSDVAALSMQVKSGDTTSLYIDTDEIAGADLMLVLKGKYLPSNFYFNKDYIIYQYMLPQVTTASVTDYGATMATLGGEVSYDGGTTVTERGVVYSATNTTPELGGTDVVKDTNGNGEETFSESISSLKPGTTYYYQAYAINSVGTSYGGVESIETYDLTAECKDITVYLDQLGAVTIDSSYVNNGSVAEAGIKTIKLSDYNFSCSDIGNNNVTMTVKDQLGSTVQCVSDVTVSDKMAPVFELIRDVEVQLSAGECETTIDYPEINVRDNCSSIELEQLQGLGSDGTFPVGVTTEIWRGTDRYGNNDIISFDVIVTAGNSVPTIDAVSDLLVDEYTSSVVVPLTGISGGEDCTMQDVEVNASADNSELISSVSVNYEEGTTGSIELFFTSATDGVSEVTVTVKDSEGAVTTERFQVTVDGSNHAPFVVDTIPNQVVNASYELKVLISSELGVLFDDIDDSSLELEVMEEGADILPSWAVYENDTLYCTPMIEDMGCSNIVVTAIDGEGATVSDTFQICVEGYPLAIGDLDDGGLLNVELYPNPTQGEAVVHINSSEIEDIEIAVMDISGRMVMRKQYSGEQTIRIDMSGKVSGMYFIRLTLDGKQVIKKLILDKK